MPTTDKIINNNILTIKQHRMVNCGAQTRQISEKCACEVHFGVKVGNGTF